MNVLQFILEIFQRFPWLLIRATALLIVTNFVSACFLFTISPLIDFFMDPQLKNVSPLTHKAVVLLAWLGLPANFGSWVLISMSLIVILSVFQILARHSIFKIIYAVVRDIMVSTMEDFLNANWYFFTSNKQGTLLNSFTRELNIIGDAFGAMTRFFIGILQLVFLLAVPFMISWQVTLISLFVSFLFMTPFIFFGKLSYRWGQQSTATANRLGGIIQESLSLVKLILGFGNLKANIYKLDKAFSAHCQVTVKSQTLNLAIPILYRPFGVVVILIALFSARKFGIALSEMTVLLLALFQVAVTIGELISNKNSLENFLPSYEQIKELRKRAQGMKQICGTKQFIEFKDRIVFKEVSFAYPGLQSVLTDVNLSIPKGKMVAFVGKSGAGKSTLIDLIMGFHVPTRGSIFIDSLPLQDYAIGSYRKKIGYVPQDSVLFNASILDNLLWANARASMEEVQKACRSAYADEFIEQLAAGYDTIVGDRGVRLSGGQVQRIALARALLRKPDLLILDEATSSLDSHSERSIQQAIDNVSSGTTVIVVAHRLSTIKSADCIYVLSGGRIVEQGTYEELIQMNNYFNRMVELQVLESAK